MKPFNCNLTQGLRDVIAAVLAKAKSMPDAIHPEWSGLATADGEASAIEALLRTHPLVKQMKNELKIAEWPERPSRGKRPAMKTTSLDMDAIHKTKKGKDRGKSKSQQ